MNFRKLIEHVTGIIRRAVIYDDHSSLDALQFFQEPDQEFCIIKGRDQDTDFQQFE